MLYKVELRYSAVSDVPRVAIPTDSVCHPAVCGHYLPNALEMSPALPHSKSPKENWSCETICETAIFITLVRKTGRLTTCSLKWWPQVHNLCTTCCYITKQISNCS